MVASIKAAAVKRHNLVIRACSRRDRPRVGQAARIRLWSEPDGL